MRIERGGCWCVGILVVGSMLLSAPVGRTQRPAREPRDADRRALVLATFLGGSITLGDMEQAIARKLPEVRAKLMEPAARGRLLEEMIRYDLLVLEAERRGYSKHDVVIEAALKVAIDKMVGREFPFAPEAIPAAEIARDYEARAGEFKRPAQRRASHIFLQREADARALLAELKDADRMEFAKLARARSQDERTRPRGGDLGYFDREGKPSSANAAEVPRAVAQATFALPREGAIAGRPVPHDGGFSIVMWTGESPKMERTLSQVEDSLREKRATELQTRQVAELVEQLRTQIKPELHPELADAIVLEPAVALDIPSGFPAAPPDPRAPPVIVEPDAI